MFFILTSVAWQVFKLMSLWKFLVPHPCDRLCNIDQLFEPRRVVNPFPLPHPLLRRLTLSVGGLVYGTRLHGQGATCQNFCT